MFSVAIEDQIRRTDAAGKKRTAQIYRTALNNFMRFREGEDLPLAALDRKTL